MQCAFTILSPVLECVNVGEFLVVDLFVDLSRVTFSSGRRLGASRSRCLIGTGQLARLNPTSRSR